MNPNMSYEDRVAHARRMRRCGASDVEIREIHGGVVLMASQEPVMLSNRHLLEDARRQFGALWQENRHGE